MEIADIIDALRCISTVGGIKNCEECPYNDPYIEGDVIINGCDSDMVCKDAADALERIKDGRN